MRFTELEPVWLIADGGEPQALETGYDRRPIKGVVGCQFLCPMCLRTDGHSIRLFMPHVPADWEPLPGRWRIIGHRLSACTIAPSVKLAGGCRAHFSIKHGALVWH